MKPRDEFLISQYKNIYIIVSSIVVFLFCEYFFEKNYIEICMGIRIYYIIFSLALLIVLNQIKKYNNQYIYKIVHSFFCIIILISFWGFIINKANSNTVVYINYIDISNKLILLVEIIIGYILSGFLLENKNEKRKYLSSIAIIIIFSMYIMNISYSIISVTYILSVAIMLSMLIINLKKLSAENYRNQYYFLIFYMLFAFLIEIYDNVNGLGYTSLKVEIAHFINFRVMWNIFSVNLVKRPFRDLSEALVLKNKDLGILNQEIYKKNIELESSICELKKNKDLEFNLYKFMPHPIVITNGRNNRIIFANDKFLDFIEVDNLKEIINKKVHKYINLKFNKMYYKSATLKYTTMNKTTKYYKVKLLDNYANENTNLIVINDLTSKVQTLKIKSELEEKKYKEHMRAKFISSISHDLKTPINVIYSASQVEYIYLKNKDISNLNKYNNISKSNCISLIGLTNNLIDNSKIKSNYLVPNLSRKNIVKIIEENFMRLMDYVKLNEIDMFFYSNVKECYICIDEEFIQRIILNLISNAVKYTPPNGKIYVSITKNNSNVEISVRDTGTGLKKDFIEKAFDIYSISENKQMDLKSGSGIGLFVVKELVELQNGIVKIKNNIDCGANCILSFPLK